MEVPLELVPVYFEIGNKRTFACSVDWQGWCRSGHDEKRALQVLFEYGPRYAKAISTEGFGFLEPADVSTFTIVESLKGNATTDFGAPDITPSADISPVNDAELERFKVLLKCCWTAFDTAVSKAEDKQLRLGPRGGGRNLEEILRHVVDANAAYLSRISWKFSLTQSSNLKEALSQTRNEVLKALESSARGNVPERGPRGGKRWTLRFFIRRLSWHVLDHTWEIEDRTPWV